MRPVAGGTRRFGAIAPGDARPLGGTANRASAAHCPQSSVMTGYSATRTTYSTELVRQSYVKIVGDASHRCAVKKMTQFDLKLVVETSAPSDAGRSVRPARHDRAAAGYAVLSSGLLVVGQIGVDERAGTGRPGGHVVGAFSEPLQGLGVPERDGRF